MSPLIKNVFCSYCGSAFQDVKDYPKTCSSCGETTYNNPLPISVTLIRVELDDREQTQGLLLVKRSIEPEIGGWCFPGGYIVSGETWQQGAAREVKEEVGLELSPDNFTLLDIVSAPKTFNVLIFNIHKEIFHYNDIRFMPNNEVSEIRLVSNSEELCFPTHTLYMKRYFDRFNNG